MLVHLRVFSMSVLAFVLVTMASSVDDMDFSRSGNSLQTRSLGLRSGNVDMVFEVEAKANLSGSFQQPRAPRRDVVNDAKVAASTDNKTHELMLDSGLRAAIKREASSGLGLFTFIGHESSGKTASRSDSDRVAFSVQPAIAINSVVETDASGTDVFVVYGPVQGVDGASLNVLGQQFDLSGIEISELDLRAAVGRSAYLEAQQTGDAFRVTRIELFGEFSVPGASPVLVVGNVTKVDSGIGRLQIGSLEVDTTIMGTEIRFESGRQVSIIGTQPVLGGLILSQQNPILDSNLIGAIGSSEVVSLSGSSVRGISGSSRSVRGISGSSRSVRGISGSSRSVRGISGSSRSVRGISGSSSR